MASTLTDLLADTRKLPLTDKEAGFFWSKVLALPLECWLWTGATVKGGYGMFSVRRQDKTQSWLAHRVSFFHFNGELPGPGLEVSHLCNDPLCVNPDHLVAETHVENLARSIGGHRRKEVCPQGHPYSGENLRVTAQGWRQCKICCRENLRRSRARRRVRNVD